MRHARSMYSHGIPLSRQERSTACRPPAHLSTATSPPGGIRMGFLLIIFAPRSQSSRRAGRSRARYNGSRDISTLDKLRTPRLQYSRNALRVRQSCKHSNGADDQGARSGSGCASRASSYFHTGCQPSGCLCDPFGPFPTLNGQALDTWLP